jgi:hypothetical protein
MTARETGAVENTDREIWRERDGDYYADSIHVTAQGLIGIDCGGQVIVKPVREWHSLAARPQPAPAPTPAGEIVERAARAQALFEKVSGTKLVMWSDETRAYWLGRLDGIEQQAATIAELREVLEMTTRALEIVNETMAEQGFGQSNSSVAVAQIGRATLERTRGQ